MIFVLCVSITDPVLLSETQIQEIEPGFKGGLDSSDNDKSINGFIPGLATNDFLSSYPVCFEILPPVFGSDAYPGSILHGPPAPGYPV